MLFIANGEEEDNEEIEIEGTEKVQEAKVLEIDENVKLSLRLILGFSTRGTMKLKGVVEGKEVTVLIDSRDTHNFIHKKIVQDLQLPLSKTTNYGVVVGNRVEIRGKGVCKVVVLRLPKLIVTVDFLPLDLGRMDVILGMQWLCTTGFMGVHWPTLIMTFASGDTQSTLKGDLALTNLKYP